MTTPKFGRNEIVADMSQPNSRGTVLVQVRDIEIRYFLGEWGPEERLLYHVAEQFAAPGG